MKKVKEKEPITKTEDVLRNSDGMRIKPETMEIDWDWYSGNDIKYPSKEDYMRYWLYRKGEVILNGVSKEEYVDKIQELVADKGMNPNMKEHDNQYWSRQTDLAYLEKLGYVKQYDYDVQYKIDYSSYNKEKSYRVNEFATNTIKAHGLEGHPKADKAYSEAWERGHSSGLSEVYNSMYRIADLVL